MQRKHMQRKQVPIGDSHLDVLDVGSGPVLLFVHGFPLDHTIWNFQVDEFSKTHRVICPDLSGFGTSPASEGELTMKGLAVELNMMLDGLGVDQPVCYCGLSMGGYIGWEFWNHYRSRLSHIVACDTRAAADSELVRRARGVSAKSVLENGTSEMANQMVEKLLFEKYRSSEIADQVSDTIRGTDPKRVAQGQNAMGERNDATDWLKEIEIPTLFVVGEFDEITTPEEMEQNAGLVSGSSFAVIPDAGHLAPLENPSRFNNELKAFLKGDREGEMQ